MCIKVSHPFKAFFLQTVMCLSLYPLGGGSTLCLNFLLICPLSPAPVLLSQDWLQTPSSFPVEKHTKHKHEGRTDPHSLRKFSHFSLCIRGNHQS